MRQNENLRENINFYASMLEHKFMNTVIRNEKTADYGRKA